MGKVLQMCYLLKQKQFKICLNTLSEIVSLPRIMLCWREPMMRICSVLYSVKIIREFICLPPVIYLVNMIMQHSSSSVPKRGFSQKPEMKSLVNLGCFITILWRSHPHYCLKLKLHVCRVLSWFSIWLIAVNCLNIKYEVMKSNFTREWPNSAWVKPNVASLRVWFLFFLACWPCAIMAIDYLLRDRSSFQRKKAKISKRLNCVCVSSIHQLCNVWNIFSSKLHCKDRPFWCWFCVFECM